MLIRGPFYITILLTVLFYRRMRKLLRRRIVLSIVLVLGIITCSFASFHFTTLREFLSGSREYQFAKRVKNAAQRVVVKFNTPEQKSVFALTNQDLYRKVAPSVVLVSCPGKGYGTGFFYGREGIIVTNHHVMQGVTHAEIVTHRGQRYPVHGIVAEDSANDLILLSTGIPPDEIRALTVNTASDPGDRVIVVSRHKVFTDALAEGTVSSVPVHPWVGIRLATPLTYGASGSPVCNSRGEVVAIIRAGDQKDNQTGFAIPAARLSALAARNPYPLSQMAASETLDTSILATSAARDPAAR
jgi:S1-C subfamily serine protease